MYRTLVMIFAFLAIIGTILNVLGLVNSQDCLGYFSGFVLGALNINTLTWVLRRTLAGFTPSSDRKMNKKTGVTWIVIAAAFKNVFLVSFLYVLIVHWKLGAAYVAAGILTSLVAMLCIIARRQS